MCGVGRVGGEGCTGSEKGARGTRSGERARVAAVVLAVSLLSAGCGSGALREAAPPEPGALELQLPSNARPGFESGEELIADIYLEGVSAGQLAGVAGPRCRLGDGEALLVRSAARSSGLAALLKDARASLVSLVDVRSGLPVQSRTHQQVRRPVQVEAIHAGELVHLQTTRSQRRKHSWQWELPPDTHDLHSLLGRLRHWSPEVRPRARVHLLLGKRLWRVELTFRGREVLDRDEGPRPALRIDGVGQRLRKSLEPSKARPRSFAVWISDDAERVPLRFLMDTKAGEVRAELDGYRRSKAQAAGAQASRPGRGMLRCPVVAVVDDDEQQREAGDERAQPSAIRTGRRDRPR